MNRVKLTSLVGAALAALGLFLALGAHTFATTWQDMGEGDRWGTADSRAEANYRVLGLVLLCGGLFVAGLAANRWMADGAPKRQDGASLPA